MKSFGDMMKQAQKMQKQMGELQTQLAEQRYEATAGGGLVKAVVDGKQMLKELKLSRSEAGAEDAETDGRAPDPAGRAALRGHGRRRPGEGRRGRQADAEGVETLPIGSRRRRCRNRWASSRPSWPSSATRPRPAAAW